ncbi:MAG: translation initiation factor IF-2 [Verrucomicrobiales bacterium]
MPSDETPKKKATAKKKAATKKVAAKKVAAKKTAKKTAAPAKKVAAKKAEVKEAEDATGVEAGQEEPAAAPPEEAEKKPAAAKTVAESKSEALSIFEKPAKRVRKKKTAAAEPAPAEEPVVDPNVKTVQETKDEALSLFEEQEKREEAKTDKKRFSGVKTAEGTGLLPKISKLLEDDPEPEAAAEESDGEDSNVIHIKPPIIVKDLADRMSLKPFKIIQDLMELDIFASADSAVEPETATTICEKHGFVFEKEKREKGAGVHKVEEVIEEPPPPPEEPEPVDEGEEIEELPLRAPIVTFMGHVDHGKTSLLDAVRKSRVTSGEAGGITQHINAYSVEHNGHPITFIDTPGHAAFSEMRARGAGVTDVVVLVVAADDGLMPQTLEALDHAQAADVAIIIAINKCDLPAADVMKVKAQLQEKGLTPEDWGGDTICVETSATTGAGVDDLLEMITLQAEVLELRANPDLPARAVVIEARSKEGKGPTASVIVETGTLKVGKAFICGAYSGKVKGLVDDLGKAVKSAPPATPVEVLGFSGLPNVGDEVVVMDSERDAKRLSSERLEELRKEKLGGPQKSTLETFFSDLDAGSKKKMKIILKSDVQGSLEAIKQALSEIESEKIELDILRAAAGPITESDVLLGSASDAILVGFNVKVESNAVAAAKREGIQVKLYSIIYELIDQMTEAMLGMLDPETRESIIGHAEVKEVFKLSVGMVAGCLVMDGRMDKQARARVLRDGQPVYDGGVATLKRFQDDVKEVKTGLECGIRLGKFSEYKKGDVIECYLLENLELKL